MVTGIERPPGLLLLTVRPEPGEYCVEVALGTADRDEFSKLRIGETIRILLTPQGYIVRPSPESAKD